MAKRHSSGDHLISQVRRCQELIMARTGADEFYETIRLLLAKKFWEDGSNSNYKLNYQTAQELLTANNSIVDRFVEGSTTLSAPADVAEECLSIVAPNSLSETSYEVLHTIFEQMTGRHYKSEKGQFFTPPHVVDFCVSVLKPKRGESICDPACGSGAFLKSAYDMVRDGEVVKDIYGFDISRRAAKTANLLSFLACDDRVKVHQADSLARESASLFGDRICSIEDIMREQSPGFAGFDVIATNPPFAGDVSGADFLSYYETARLGSAKLERDTIFLERCYQLLKPGGRLGIVLPDNKFSGSRFSELREWMVDKFKVVSVVSLHSYTFRPFTSQKTCVLFAEKKPSVRDGDEIIFYRSDKAGKSSNGDPVFVNGNLDHDLDEIAADLCKEWSLG